MMPQKFAARAMVVEERVERKILRGDVLSALIISCGVG